jgi:hypothetical protein
VHVEFHSNDPVRTKQFYGQVFGYKFEDIPAMNYSLWKAPGGPAGGLMKVLENRPPQVLNYLLANDIERTLAKVSAAGGAVLQPKMEIPGQGWWALFQEPGGTVMALYQNLQRPQPARKPAARKAAKTTKKASKGRRRK